MIRVSQGRLDNKEVVDAYREEFNRIIQNHELVQNIIAKRKFELSINSSEYLTSDYTFQAKKEEQLGNDLAVAKIYTEILRLNNKELEIQEARTAIVNKINSQKFETCPFEIGILFRSGYTSVIPVFTPLPITIKRNGATPINNATSLQITIQKYDYKHQTILQFTMDNLKIAPADTLKIEHTMTIDQNGLLTVNCVELNGYGRTITKYVDLKKFL